MEVPYDRWHAGIEKRRSRRQFDETRLIESGVLSELQTLCDEFRPFPGARATLITESVQSVFRGIIGGYGKVRGAPAFVAVIGDTDNAGMNEAAGFTGQGIVLEATALGLSTCWIAMFKRTGADALVDLRGNERILAVIPLGHTTDSISFQEKVMTVFGRNHRRLPLEKLVSGLDTAPEWARKAVNSARLAPSAMNRQPWGFELSRNSITVSMRTSGMEASLSKRLDCGIAMLHIEVTAGHHGKAGSWQFLKSPQVARFNAND